MLGPQFDSGQVHLGVSMKDCVKLDGCCATHGSCFKLVEDENSQACEGWPCLEMYNRWETEGGSTKGKAKDVRL